MIHTNRIIRPPFERRSKILHVTTGCSHNKCSFCNYNKNTTYKIRTIDEIKNDIIKLKKEKYVFRRLWLQSADPFALDTDYLLKIAYNVNKYLPFVESIGSYARIDNLNNKTEKDLILLREHGYNHIVFGLESGDDNLLGKVNKGYDRQEALRQLTKINNAGMDYTLIYLCGLGGLNYGMANAYKTAPIINKLNVERIMINTLTLLENTPLYDDNTFKTATEKEKLSEIITFIKQLNIETFIDATHASNTIKFFGEIPKNKMHIIDHLEEILNNNTEEQLKQKHKKIKQV